MTPRGKAPPGGERVLVVNADDFGMTRGINRGILRAHRDGIVTSASLMVFRPAAVAAVAAARRHPGLGLGLHIELGSWRRRGGEWISDGHAVDTDDADAVSASVAAQLERFVRMTGRAATHLDSHQHLHLEGAARGVIEALGRRLDVPVRGLAADVATVGDFFGQDRHGVSYPEWVSADALLRIVRSIPAGTTELVCHPGAGDDAPDDYRNERALELEALCDVSVADAIDELGIDLRAFGTKTAPRREHAQQRNR